jgi:hypothetical protein
MADLVDAFARLLVSKPSLDKHAGGGGAFALGPELVVGKRAEVLLEKGDRLWDFLEKQGEVRLALRSRSREHDRS